MIFITPRPRPSHAQNLLPEQTSALTKHVYHKVYAAGDNIYKDGDPASAYYIVASGHVQILRKRENDDSKRVVVAEHFTGESFGEATLSLGPKTRHTTIGFCYSQCEIFTITRQGYMETVAKSHFERVQVGGDVVAWKEALRRGGRGGRRDES